MSPKSRYLRRANGLPLPMFPRDPPRSSRWTDTQKELFQGQTLDCEYETVPSPMPTTVPFTDIPNDILLEIFILTRTNDNPSAFLSSRNPASLLIEVCKRWKNVALSCSALWNQVTIRMRPSSFNATRLRDAEHLLERSKHRPLTLSIGVPYSKVERINRRPTKTPRPTPFAKPNFLGQLLQPVVGRLWSILISGTALKDILDLNIWRLNTLERVALDINPTIMDQYRKIRKASGKIGAFQHAPQLRRVAVTNHYVGHELLDIPWEKLTHFLEIQRFDKPRSKDFIFTDTMRRCTQLRHLATTLSKRTDEAGQAHGETHTLEWIQSLTVNGWALGETPLILWSRVDDIFKRFKMPRLTSLRITANFIDNIFLGDPSEYSPGLIAALNGLEYLSLTCALDNSHEHYLLRLTPALRTLDIHFAFDDDEYGTMSLFKHLTVKEDGGDRHSLVPLLETLIIDASTFPNGSILPGVREFNGGQLRKFLRSRTDGRASPGTAPRFKVVVYTADDLRLAPPSDLFDMYGEDWVGVLNDFAEEGKIQFETRMITERVRLCSSQKYMKGFHAGQGWWMYRAPELEDWPEAKELVKGLAE